MKSSGRCTLIRAGSTLTDAEHSIVSSSALNAIHEPEYRDIAKPCTPRSRYSCTPDGESTGIIGDISMVSLCVATVDERAMWSSPQTSSTPPCGAAPAELPCSSASPQRASPAHLPYHMPNTPW